MSHAHQTCTVIGMQVYGTAIFYPGYVNPSTGPAPNTPAPSATTPDTNATAAAPSTSNSTAPALDADFWAAPACNHTLTDAPLNWVSDKSGRKWGWANNASCRFAGPHGEALFAPNATSPATANTTGVMGEWQYKVLVREHATEATINVAATSTPAPGSYETAPVCEFPLTDFNYELDHSGR